SSRKQTKASVSDTLSAAGRSLGNAQETMRALGKRWASASLTSAGWAKDPRTRMDVVFTLESSLGEGLRRTPRRTGSLAGPGVGPARLPVLRQDVSRRIWQLDHRLPQEQPVAEQGHPVNRLPFRADEVVRPGPERPGSGGVAGRSGQSDDLAARLVPA